MLAYQKTQDVTSISRRILPETLGLDLLPVEEARRLGAAYLARYLPVLRRVDAGIHGAAVVSLVLFDPDAGRAAHDMRPE